MSHWSPYPFFLAKNIRNQRCLITMYLKISLQDTDYTFRHSNYRLQRTLNINNKLNMYYTLTSPKYSISSKTDWHISLLHSSLAYAPHCHPTSSSLNYDPHKAFAEPWWSWITSNPYTPININHITQQKHLPHTKTQSSNPKPVSRTTDIAKPLKHQT